MWVYHLEYELTKKVLADVILSDGWKKGRVLDFDKKRKQLLKKQQLSKVRKDKQTLYTELHKQYTNQILLNVDDFSKNTPLSSSALLRAWKRLGLPYIQHSNVIRNMSQKERVYIHKGMKVRRIKQVELSVALQNGWLLGRLKK